MELIDGGRAPSPRRVRIFLAEKGIDVPRRQIDFANWEQFSGRSVPFGGDYLYVSSVGAFSYGVWTDWRNVVAGTDPREGGDSDADGADVKQCRAQNPDGSFGPDTCPFAGGLDQNIYGDYTP